MTTLDTTTTRCAMPVEANHPLAETVEGRADIFAMTELSHDAALTPVQPGGLSHAERAALACRIAHLNGEETLATHFAGLMATANASAAIVAITDPNFDGGADRRVAALLRHTDLATCDTKSVVAADITCLSNAGISEDDIVRLSQLVAFVNYQARVTRGLRLMVGAR